jgi:hypothetical protein
MVLLSVCVVSAEVSWDYIWAADEMPEVFSGGTIFSHVAYVPADTDLIRSIDGGVYTTETICLIDEQVSPNSNSYFTTKADVFDASIPATIEFKYRADKELKPYINYFLIKQAGVGDLGFNFRASHQVLNRYDGSQNFVAYKDINGWSVFRVLTEVSNGDLTGASLYYKDGDGDWVLGMTVSTNANTGVSDSAFTMGDGGSNWAGQWSVDYFHWTSQAATLEPIPVPVVVLPAWDYAWDADQLPEEFVAGSILKYTFYQPTGTVVNRGIDSGIYTFETVLNEAGTINSNCNVSVNKNKFNSRAASTIEFRYRAELEAKPYISTIWFNVKDTSEIHFNILLNHQINDGRDPGNNFIAYKDAEGWSTLRVLTNVVNGVLESADMYYKDAQGDWAFGINVPVYNYANTAEDGFSFGDLGSNWGGKCSVDYLYWTSSAATLGDLDAPATPIRSDIDGDGDVDCEDFAILASRWLSDEAV